MRNSRPHVRRRSVWKSLSLLLALVAVTALASLWIVQAQGEDTLPPDTAQQEPGGEDTSGQQPPDQPAEEPSEEASEEPTQETPDPPQNTVPPPVSVTGSEPSQVTSGMGGSLSVFGASFTEQVRVRLVGYGVLTTGFINSTTLTAELPAALPPGDYAVEVLEANGNAARSPNSLRVNRPPNTEGPPTLAPTERPIPTETPVPSPIPGQPSLLARNFTANPAAILPGGTTTITFEVVNQGNRPALGVSVAVDPGEQFAPANGQAGATLPDIAPNTMFTVSLSVVAGVEAPGGPGSIPITFTYHDFEGNPYTSKATLSVNIIAVDEASQVTLARYLTNPSPVVPGESVTVTVLITNTGNQTASQVLLRVAGEGSVLLAGPQGDSFPIGDMAPGASASLDLPLVVRGDADAGPQPQAITLTYLQAGESKETTGAMTVQVAEVIEPEPLILLQAYDVGQEVLRPGDRFTFDMTLQNVGDAAATNMLVVFGTVEVTGGSGGGDTTGGDSVGGGGTSTTPSSTFAPLGAGGTVYVGTIGPDGADVSLSQDFIVTGGVKSGIYSLPITLRYLKPDGSSAQDSLNASVVVVTPPDLQTTIQTPLPETVNVGEPFPVAVELANSGTARIALTGAEVTVDRGEVLEGQAVALGPLAADDDTMINGLVMPTEEGPLRVTVTIRYLDDLFRAEEIVLTYDTEAVAPPPPVEEPPPPDDPGVVVIEEPSQEELVGRLLLGFLGLGS